MSDDTFTVHPTVLYRATAPDTLEAAVVDDPDGGERRALLVFRDEEEAEKYRAATGRYPASEGWRPVNLDHRDLANVVAMHGCTHVAMPEPWTGEGAVDFFDAGGFIGMLEASPPATA